MSFLRLRRAHRRPSSLGQRTNVVTALLCFVLVGGASGCGKHLYNRDDLTVDLAKHHIDLRWGRLDHAAMRVNPELRAAFLQTWAQRLASLELQELDVTGVAILDDDTADVVVTVTFIDKATMAVKTMQVPERWVRTETGWMLQTVAELPGG